MSASRNADSVTNAQGEVHSKVPRDEPMTTKGHAPGVKVGNDTAPEFHAHTVTPGTGPSDRTFAPNTSSEIPGQAMNPDISKETWTSASDTIGGATSADVHQGLGVPGSGQTSSELHGGSRKKERSGLEGVRDTIAESVPRPATKDHEEGVRGDRENLKGAEEREPVGAEQL